jgi:hypothetical protein
LRRPSLSFSPLFSLYTSLAYLVLEGSRISSLSALKFYVIAGHDSGDGWQAASIYRLLFNLGHKTQQALEVPCLDYGSGALAGIRRSDCRSLPQSEQERRAASVPLGHNAADHLQQHLHSLIDPAMEKALMDVPTMSRIAGGIELINDWIPDETMILAVLLLLEKHGLG